MTSILSLTRNLYIEFTLVQCPYDYDNIQSYLISIKIKNKFNIKSVHMAYISVIKLIKTNILLHLNQKAEKRYELKGAQP